jgi:16S rRNA processing protein RimM
MAGERILLGMFGAPHGVRGELRLKSFTSEPEAIARYGPLESEDGRRFEILSVRPQKDVLIVRVAGVSDRSAAEALVNLHLHAPRERLGGVAPDEFFHADLIGLEAQTPEGALLGRIVALHDFGAGDILEVRPGDGGPSRLFPFTRDVVPVVDLAGGRLVLVPPREVGDPEPGA